ncbi:unnamed protein product [Didymodactylos carnosus]|uniref:DUF4139 domain-containing protein n=1 Tax=Didymodactylos carnosus TaxID=1234261 RepID=A0A814KL03_9BILA|nr:unnamed protein product [Didymodactylos carnosus]CAF1052785.1 unnamed protein product [Didymodactylos carnosus]CAF3780520.1 unnamed protein product [Didymodactylos carnosus]CAF3822185.1 unnamed protein product [Didymodactylos carnosus]
MTSEPITITTSDTTISNITTAPSTTPTIIRSNIDKECPIKYVTVYNDRAEITRSFNQQFDLDGTYELILDGFSNHVDQNSFHVKGGTGKATILEVSYHTRYEKSQTDTTVAETKHKQIQKQVFDLNNDIAQHQQELDRINKNIDWLDGHANHLMNNKEKNDNSLQETEQFLDFYYQKLKTLDEKKMTEEHKLKSLNEQRETLMKNLNTYGTNLSSNVMNEHREITILLNVQDKKSLINLEISYLTLNCSWKASYDVRVTSENKSTQTELTYYGIITNKSNENWINAHFSLSTATPSLGGTPPKLSTLNVNYKQPYYRPSSRDYYADCASAESVTFYKQSKKVSRLLPKVSMRRNSNAYDREAILENDDEDEVGILVSKAETGLSSTNFTIPRSATIECDGKPHKVTIGVLYLESKFTYTCVPKLSPYAYLKATTTNTSDKQLLSGPINVFMDNNFITHSQIGNVSIDEKFDLYLGIDSNVKCEYKPVHKMNDIQGLISKVNHEYVKHETKIKNLKANDICIYVYDHLPLSTDEKIKVKLLQPQDIGKLKEHSITSVSVIINDDNNMEWKVLLKAKEECKLPLEYLIEWPKEKQIEYKE